MGLLIVNADDLGRDVATTDAVLGCFRAGRITSASAMVWMADSKRAASLALLQNLPVRLHLNLTDPFTGPSVPADVRKRQIKIARHFRHTPLATWICNPRQQKIIERCIEDQLHAFAELYGEPPSAVDGHNHIHTCLNVLLARSLRDVSAMRATFTFLPEEKGFAKRGLRAIANGIMRRRFESTQRFMSLRNADLQIGGNGLASKVAQARLTSVEVMTHPRLPDEYEFLMSTKWQQAIANVQLGTLSDLNSRRRHYPRRWPATSQ
jgi:predicted glycoside hydrolase/deacetylase ChbG (UPF0249 family)